MCPVPPIGPSSVTLEEFQFIRSPVELPLCSIYPTLKISSEKKLDVKHKTRPRGLRFVSSFNGVTFKDENFVLEVASKLEQLKRAAVGTDMSSNNIVLAKKALQYRRVDLNHGTPSDILEN